MPKIVVYQTAPVWFVKNECFMAKIRAGVKYVLSNTNTNTNTKIWIFQIQIQIFCSTLIQIQIQIHRFKYKYKYKYVQPNISSETVHIQNRAILWIPRYMGQVTELWLSCSFSSTPGDYCLITNGQKENSHLPACVSTTMYTEWCVWSDPYMYIKLGQCQRNLKCYLEHYWNHYPLNVGHHC